MPPRIVLDTNVLIAALRSKRGASFRLLRALGSRAFHIVVSVPVVLEYEEVAKRQARALGLTVADVDAVVDYVCAVAEHHAIFFLWRPLLSDPHDDMLLELAVEAQCDAIVTCNTADFVGTAQFGIRVLTPPQFVDELGGLR